MVALGIAADGQKHALGLWEGATENTAVCQDLLANLQSRGLRTDRSLLVILDGALALHKATRAVFGEAALIQRSQVHKLRNILDHLPERQRPWVHAVVRRAYQATDVKVANRLLTDLAKRLDDEYPSAAESAALRYGGDAVVSSATGLSRNTIKHGRRELTDGGAPAGRLRRAGAGRPPIESRQPGLTAALEALGPTD